MVILGGSLETLRHLKRSICCSGRCFWTGFPPIPGQKVTTAEQGLFAALEAASKISTTDDDAGSADEEEEKEVEVGAVLFWLFLFFHTAILQNCFCTLVRSIITALTLHCVKEAQVLKVSFVGKEEHTKRPGCVERSEKISVCLARENIRRRSLTCRSVLPHGITASFSAG